MDRYGVAEIGVCFLARCLAYKDNFYLRGAVNFY